MNYTTEEQIEILKGRRLDRMSAISRAFSEEDKAKIRVELRRIEAELKRLEETK